MSAVAVRNNFSDFFGTSMLPVLEHVFTVNLNMHQSVRDQISRKATTDRDIWQASSIQDLEKFKEVPENTSYSYVRPKQGSNKTFVMTKYGLGVSISEEAVSDGKFQFISDMVAKLGRSAAESREVQFMDLFNNGFASATTSDGQPIFDLAHTLPSGGTFRNELASAADLDTTSLDTALIDFAKQFVGDGGTIYNIKPKILLVPEELKRTAMEIVGSELKANTPNNNMNPFKSEGLTVISSPHLTDSDAWFLLADPSEHYIWSVQRQGVMTKAGPEAVGFHTDSIFYKASYRDKVGATEAYGAFGSPGA